MYFLSTACCGRQVSLRTYGYRWDSAYRDAFVRYIQSFEVDAHDEMVVAFDVVVVFICAGVEAESNILIFHSVLYGIAEEFDVGGVGNAYALSCFLFFRVDSGCSCTVVEPCAVKVILRVTGDWLGVTSRLKVVSTSPVCCPE